MKQVCWKTGVSLIVAVLLLAVYLCGVAEQGPVSGSAGENVIWCFENGILTVSGKGEVSCDDSPNAPWEAVKPYILRAQVQEGVTDLGPFAFASCSLLEEVSLPETLEGISRGAFTDCAALREIDLPGKLVTVGEHAFTGCTGLREIRVPEGVTRLEDHAFDGCKALETVTLPENSLVKIGEYAFNECDSLSGVQLPSSLLEVGGSAFYGAGLTGLALPEGIRCVPECLVCECERLVYVTVPEGAETVGSYAFAFCPLLKELSLPGSLTEIARDALKESSPRVLCPEGSFARLWAEKQGFDTGDPEPALPRVPESATLFLPEGLIRVGEEALSMTGARKIVIPDGAEEIGKGAFLGCPELILVRVPPSVTRIAEDAFDGCSRELVILAPAGSAAESFAREQGILFVSEK